MDEEVRSSRSSKHLDAKIYPHPYQPDDQKFWEYDRYAQMTLQEAFRAHRYDVICNSRRRIRELKAKEARRQLAKELLLGAAAAAASDEYSTTTRTPLACPSAAMDTETELYRQMAHRLEYATRRQVIDRHRELCARNRRFAYFTELSTPGAKRVPVHHCNAGPPPTAAMSQREIKERTRRKYEKLPEVQQRLLREKLEENKVKNRIKSNIFKKVRSQSQHHDLITNTY